MTASGLPPLSHVATALLPVLLFLVALVLLDSYKLLRPRAVAGLMAGGVLAAAASYGVSLVALQAVGVAPPVYSAWIAPWVEEALKGLPIVVLLWRSRIAFLVDAAICGFAIGSGFAWVENLAYLHLASGAGLATWIVRGLGTAVMHGGATAILAVLALSLADRRPGRLVAAAVPGLVLAALLHTGFNALTTWPQVATLVTIAIVPMLLMLVFQRSERLLADWLGSSFDADAQMLEVLNSGAFADSPAGRYLRSLRQGFSGPVMADVLCYLRLYTELSLRAKGMLMLRENGLPVPPPDEELRERLVELHYLERSIGPTGLRALGPLLRMGRKELRQITLLEAA